MNRKLKIIGSVVLSAGMMLSACSNVKSEQKDKPAVEQQFQMDNKPVTLKFYAYNQLSDEDFQTVFVNPIKEKFPNITMERVTLDKGVKIGDYVAAGGDVDIVTTWAGNIGVFEDLQMTQDLTPLAKKHGIDLNLFEPVTLDAARSTDKTKLYGFPWYIQFSALYYNKDIFDKFGVPYPKDGMTWDETIDLAKKVTRSADGIQYKGLGTGLYEFSSPLSLSYVNPQTGRAAIATEDWKKVFQLQQQVDSIPGNSPQSFSDFYTAKTLAMWANQNRLSNMKDGAANGLNWDIAQFPSYKEHPNTHVTVDEHVLFTPVSSKNQDAAMEVIKAIVSDEVQKLSAAKTGRASALKNPDIQKDFGKDMDFLKGKHIEALFKSKPSAATFVTPYNADFDKISAKYYDSVLKGNMDINSALQAAEEEMNKFMDAAKK